MSKPNRIMFLDVDGVLNSAWSFENIGLSWPTPTSIVTPTNKQFLEHDPCWIPRAKEIIKRLVEEHNFHIVMSSTWRQHVPLHIFAHWLDVPVDRLIGKTPAKLSGIRGQEISAFIHDALGEGLIDPKFSYVIIDDSIDMLKHQLENHFVRTKFGMSEEDGLNEEHYNQILRLIQIQESKHENTL